MVFEVLGPYIGCLFFYLFVTVFLVWYLDRVVLKIVLSNNGV